MIDLYNLDFLENNLENELVDAVITDPPYGVKYDIWDYVGKFEIFHKLWLKEVYKLSKSGSTIWSFMAYTDKKGLSALGTIFNNIMRNIGFETDLRNSIVWARQKGRGASKHLKSQREDVYYAVKPGAEKTWHPLKMLREVVTPYMKDGRPRGWFLDEHGNRVRWTGLGNVQTYSSPQWNHKTEKQFHSAQKPVMLMDRLIRLTTNEGDTVLDPFMGSGTTGIACLLSNRNFIGFEKDKEIFDKAKERINNFNKKDYYGYNAFTDKEIENLMKKIQK